MLKAESPNAEYVPNLCLSFAMIHARGTDLAKSWFVSSMQSQVFVIHEQHRQ